MGCGADALDDGAAVVLDEGLHVGRRVGAVLVEDAYHGGDADEGARAVGRHGCCGLWVGVVSVDVDRAKGMRNEAAVAQQSSSRGFGDAVRCSNAICARNQPTPQCRIPGPEDVAMASNQVLQMGTSLIRHLGSGFDPRARPIRGLNDCCSRRLSTAAGNGPLFVRSRRRTRTNIRTSNKYPSIDASINRI